MTVVMVSISSMTHTSCLQRNISTHAHRHIHTHVHTHVYVWFMCDSIPKMQCMGSLRISIVEQPQQWHTASRLAAPGTAKRHTGFGWLAKLKNAVYHGKP